jgi:NAD(P)-dependent dehydrogenase (short-subunit alcohol dehydrogenase family)
MSVDASRIAVVTGASRGIGLAIVQERVKADYGVYAIAREVERVTPALAPEIVQRKVVPVALDITRPADVQALFADQFDDGREIARGRRCDPRGPDAATVGGGAKDPGSDRASQSRQQRTNVQARHEPGRLLTARRGGPP